MVIKYRIRKKNNLMLLNFFYLTSIYKKYYNSIYFCCPAEFVNF